MTSNTWPSGSDVLVDTERVVRVVPPLDLDEAVVVALVVRADALLVVGGHEVDVPALLRQRRRRVVEAAHPGDVRLVFSRVGPHAGDHRGEVGVAVREGRRVGGYVVRGAVDRIDVDGRVDGREVRPVLEGSLDC